MSHFSRIHAGLFLFIISFGVLSPYAIAADVNSAQANLNAANPVKVKTPTNNPPPTAAAKSTPTTKSPTPPTNSSNPSSNTDPIRKRAAIALNAQNKKNPTSLIQLQKDNITPNPAAAKATNNTLPGTKANGVTEKTLGSFTAPKHKRLLFPNAKPTTQAAATDFNLNSTSSGTGSWALQTIVALAVVLALIFFLRSFMMKLSGATPAGVNASLIEVLAKTNIGPKTNVLFLKVNQKVIITGQTPAGLNPLATLDDPEDVAWVLSQVEASKANSMTQSFKRMLQGFDKDYQPDVTTEEFGADTSEQYVDRTHNEVSGLLSRLKHFQNRITNKDSSNTQ